MHPINLHIVVDSARRRRVRPRARPNGVREAFRWTGIALEKGSMHALPGPGPGPGHINIFVKRLSLHVLCKSAWRYMEQLALHKEALGATLLNFHLQRMALHMGSVWRYMESVWRYIVRLFLVIFPIYGVVFQSF